jgi:HD-like signal output (HDOD) protein
MRSKIHMVVRSWARSSHPPPATRHQPPATSHPQPATRNQPPATSHQPPATSHQPTAASTQVPAHPAEKEYGRLRIDQALQLDATGRLNKEDKLDLCVRRIFHSEGVPPFCDHANEIMVRTLDLDAGSSKELVRIILQDLGLATQVLRLANSAMYNHSGRPILSIAHAVILLGWLQVRNMVSAVRFIEHFANRSPGLREMVLLSVLTAAQSRDVAAAIGYPRPEEAYICGLFRNLGEVLIACHFPNEYSRVILTMEEEKIPERAACVRILDFSWDDVGMLVAESWNMPAQVRQSMAGGTLTGSPLDRCLASIANYGHNLTRVLYRKGAAVDTVHLETVLDTLGQPSLVSIRDLCRIVDSAVIETRETFLALQIPTETLRLSKQAERARQILESMPVFDSAGLNTLDQAIQRAAGILKQGVLELTPFISMLLDAVRTAGFERVVFGLMNENLTFIRGRLASAASVDDLLNRFQFPVDGADGPIRAALQRKEDIYVDRSRDDRYDQSALVTALEPGGFALLPIVIERKTAACLYADLHGSPRGFDAVRPAFCRVRDLIAQAIRKQASQSPSSG